MSRFKRLIGIFWLCFLGSVSPSLAAPYFYFSGPPSATQGGTYTIDVFAVSDGSTLTATQTVISFNNSYLTAKSISILGSRCSFWAPADPSLGYGNTPSPYFYPSSNSNRVVISCGFSNPGYQSADTDGDLIAKIRFTPIQLGTTSLSFVSANTLFRYIGTPLSVGTMSNFDLGIFQSTDSSTPAPTSGGSTPTPNPSSSSTASATPTPTSSSSGPVSTADQTIFTADDLTFVEIGANNQAGSTGESEDVILQVIEEDDSLPAVPDLEPRPAATPFIFKLLNSTDASNSAQNEGEVLAAQSLRELLIPGRSNADKTVVLINLISTITFLALLAVVIWRLITITKMNKLKSKHMKELLTSELAVLESKLGSANAETVAQIRQEIDETVKKLNKEV